MRKLTTATLLLMITAAPLRAQVSGNYKNMRIDEALGDIARQASLAMSFASNLPHLDDRITVQFTNIPGRDAIDRVLRGKPLEAKFTSAAAVVIRLKTPSAPAPHPTGDLERATFDAPIPIAEVVVTPSHFGVAHEAPVQRQTLTREQINTLPQLGEDIFRAINRLPGIVSNEMSAKINVRGSTDENLMVTLDGVELFEPYHLKDFDAALSIIDVAAIGGVDVATGGMPADVGNRLTGALTMRSTSRMPNRPHTSLGISLSNARFMSEGSFGDGKGLWLFSARRGYLDILLKLVNTNGHLDPKYYDLFGKVEYQLSGSQLLSLHALRADDHGSFLDDDGEGELNSKYGSNYLWLTLKSQIVGSLTARTSVSSAVLNWRREAVEHLRPDPYDIVDRRSFHNYAARQDWQLGGDRWLLRWGGEFRKGNADYDYYRFETRPAVTNGMVVNHADSIDLALSPSGTSLSGYVSQRVRIASPLTIEAGLRADQQSYTNETQISPRVNVVWAIDRRTNMRVAWGRYAQPQQLFQLHVQDNEFTFAAAERAEQVELGVDHSFARNISARVQLYRREESSLRTRYLNIENGSEPLAEAEADRMSFTPTSGRASGIEFLVQGRGERSSWSASYALAEAYDVVNGRHMPRPLQQKHTFYSDYSFSPKEGWQISAALQFHSGWPTTFAQFRADKLNSGAWYVTRTWGTPWVDKLPTYQRFDIRATRHVTLRRGSLDLFLDVFNALGHENGNRYNYSVSVNAQTGGVSTTRSIEALLPRLPTIGLTWQF